MAMISRESDWLAHLRRIPGARVSCGVVVFLLGIHALMAFTGGMQAHRGWFDAFGLSRETLFAGGVWRLVTYAWLHGNWWHVGLNAMLVLVLGARIDYIAGHALVVRVMLAGLIAGGLFHVLLAPGLLIGFSGAVMALLILLVTLSPESRMFPLPVSGKSLGLGIMAAALIFAVVHPDGGVPGPDRLGKWLEQQGMGAWFQLGHACHLGGGLAGWGIGRWMLRPRVSLARLQRDRAKREKS